MHCITNVHWYFDFFKSQNACNIIFKKKKSERCRLLARKSEQKDFYSRLHLLAERKRKKYRGKEHEENHTEASNSPSYWTKNSISPPFLMSFMHEFATLVSFSEIPILFTRDLVSFINKYTMLKVSFSGDLEFNSLKSENPFALLSLPVLLELRQSPKQQI